MAQVSFCPATVRPHSLMKFERLGNFGLATQRGCGVDEEIPTRGYLYRVGPAADTIEGRGKRACVPLGHQHSFHLVIYLLFVTALPHSFIQTTTPPRSKERLECGKRKEKWFIFGIRTQRVVGVSVYLPCGEFAINSSFICPPHYYNDDPLGSSHCASLCVVTTSGTPLAKGLQIIAQRTNGRLKAVRWVGLTGD